MNRVWLGLIALSMAGLTGCQSMRDAHQTHSAQKAEQSGITSVINTVPEPGLTWKEQSGQTAKKRTGRISGRGVGSVGAPEIPPLGDGDPAQFAAKTPNGTETGFDKNPTTDVIKALPAVAIKPNDGPFRTITEADIRRLAAAASHPAHRLDIESIIPTSHAESAGRFKVNDGNPIVVDRFLRQARDLAAKGERIKAVGEAASTFYQLADAEGQAELLRAGVEAFDKFRAEAAKPQVVNGQRFNIPPERIANFDRQRADLLKSAELLSFACVNANIDLKKQAGLVGHTTDRLYPTGEFGIDPTPVDIEAAVQKALEQRPDLQMLRLAYYDLNEDTLPAIRDQLRATVGLTAPQRLSGLIAARHPSVIRSALEHFGKKPDIDPVMVHELAVRRAQLHDLICEKEREAADQVRKAANLQNTAANLVGTLRWKSDSLKKQIDGMKVNKESMLLEWYKARAEVISAVMTWHQARVKLMAAKGELE